MHTDQAKQEFDGNSYELGVMVFSPELFRDTRCSQFTAMLTCNPAFFSLEYESLCIPGTVACLFIYLLPCYHEYALA